MIFCLWLGCEKTPRKQKNDRHGMKYRSTSALLLMGNRWCLADPYTTYNRWCLADPYTTKIDTADHSWHSGMEYTVKPSKNETEDIFFLVSLCF